MANGILLKKLVRDLWSRKGSLLALVAIMTIGVGVYVAMASVYRDMDGSRERYYREQRLPDFSVDFKRAPEWAVAEVSSLPNVREVRGRVDIAVLIDLPGREEPISGRAISMPKERRPVLNDILLRSGTWFSGNDEKEAILTHAFAKENGIVPGNRIRVLLLDEQHDLLVVGTAMSPEFVYLIPPGGALAPDPARFGVLFLPEDFLQKSCDLDGAYNQLVGLAHDTSRGALQATLELIEDHLDPYGVTNTTPTQDQVSVRFLADELRGLKISATVVPAIFLGVAALILNIIMGRMVAQQRTVIGTLKALGYSTGTITSHFLGYGIAVGLSGGLSGLALGFWLQRVFVQIYRQFFALPSIDPHFYPGILFAGIGVSVAFSVFGSIRGTRAAAKLDPAAAMRPPPPEKGGAVLPERIPYVWNQLSFRWKMILRAVFRNPFRTAVSILASTIATALIVSILSQMDSLDYLMRYEFEKVAHQDVTISLRDPRGRNSTSEVDSLPTISTTEPQLAVVCDLSNGSSEKRTAVTGIPQNNRLYTPLDSAGGSIVVPESGLVLSKKLAEVLGVAPGDNLRLRPLIGERKEVTAPVVGTVDTFLGLSAYAEIGYLSRLLGEEWTANVILGTSFPGGNDEPFLEAVKERPTVVGIGERTRQFTRMEESFGETMGTMISVMVLFAGLIAFGSVLNAALVSLSERQREVGTLRVLGYSPGQVARIFSGESFLLNAVGILIGLEAGIGLAHLLSMAYDTELYRFPAIVYPSRLLHAAILMAAFVSIAQILIYRMIRKFDWLEVLKTRE
jgi:putative ABC transport system permease protein